MMRYRTERIARVELPTILPGDGYLWVRQGEGLAAWGEAARIHVPHGPERFRRAGEELEDFFAGVERPPGAPSPIAIGSFTFESDEDGSVLVVPEMTVRVEGSDATVSVLGDADMPTIEERPGGRPVKVRYAGSTISEVEWLEVVERALKSIRSEEVNKVVLARDLAIWAEEDFDLPLLLRFLASAYPTCYTFACDGLIGATPELLIARDGRTVSSLVLAGTAPRSPDPDEDRRIGERLLASAKDLSEHSPAVASVEETLGPLCKALSVDREPDLLRLANVQHLATRVSGTLTAPISVLDLVGELHPTAAVCGQPTEDAAALIRAIEGMSRGRYAGPVGWVDADGNGEWGIALRCAQIDGSRGRLFAGGGVVGASEPEAELEETRLKFKAVMSALEGAN